MAWKTHFNPDHVHLYVEPHCGNHLECDGEDHWKGGKPQVDYPHWVEIDVETQLVGYTRLTDKEIAHQREVEIQEQKKIDESFKKVARRVAIMRGKAEEDPAYAILLEHLGISITEENKESINGN
jgi:hypothetical protein